jgi:hypothetical protein
LRPARGRKKEEFAQADRCSRHRLIAARLREAIIAGDPVADCVRDILVNHRS